MALIISQNEGHFEVAPPSPEPYDAVCVDVIDLGMVTGGQYGPKRKVKLVFQLGLRNKQRERFQVRATFTQSLFEKANLRLALEQWRGRAFAESELKNFDLEEKVLGKRASLAIVNDKSKSTGRPFAKVVAYFPPRKTNTLVAENYMREPWPSEEPGAPAPRDEPVYEVDPIDEGAAAQYDSEDVPF